MPKHLKHFIKVKVTCYAWGQLGMNQDWTINHDNRMDTLCTLYVLQPIPASPTLEILCLDVLESYLSHKHTTCSEMFDKQMMHRWLSDKSCPRATFKSVFVRDKKGGLESRYCLLCCLSQVHQVNLWRHKCDYHLRRELVKKPPHNELMNSLRNQLKTMRLTCIKK